MNHPRTSCSTTKSLPECSSTLKSIVSLTAYLSNLELHLLTLLQSSPLEDITSRTRRTRKLVLLCILITSDDALDEEGFVRDSRHEDFPEAGHVWPATLGKGRGVVSILWYQGCFM
jgi:hypothetical protein